MEGAKDLAPGGVHRRVVALEDGSKLNRYWDDSDAPRDESFGEDVAQAQQSHREPRQTYREIRAAAESGWDFSSRWFADNRTLASIDTTEIIPVDLNGLLFGLENAIRAGCERVGDHDCAEDFNRRAADRRAAIDRYLWDEAHGAFLDYRWTLKQRIPGISAATLYPLFTQVANNAQAASVARVVEKDLLRIGGYPRDYAKHRPAMGCAQRMGAATMGRRGGLNTLRRAPNCRTNRLPLDRQRLAGLSQDWQTA